MTIERMTGDAKGRSRAVAHGGQVYTVATAADTTADVAGQTEQTLAAIDRNLADCGTDKTRILSATVYLVDITRKAEMDAVWNAWIGPDNWPQRACVGAALHGNTLVEITIVATRDAGQN
jgi:enamine deaminase RidA (YjgF/YER057c/UK114 family)